VWTKPPVRRSVTSRPVKFSLPHRAGASWTYPVGWALLTEKLLDEGLIARRWTVLQLQGPFSRARPNNPDREFLTRLLLARGGDVSSDSVLEAKAFRALAPLVPFKCTSLSF
jgi:hypothetical protein